MYTTPEPHQPSDDVIDLRSDTVSRPTPAMRHAMAEAEVGDDVFGDDPTVNKLEAMSAQLLNKEAAVFVPTGTMANAVSALAHLRRGDEVILGARSHMYRSEQAGLAVLSQAQAVPIMENADGTLPLDQIESSIRSSDQHYPITRLICLENTHNATGGQPLTVEYTNQVGAIAKKHGLKFHIDGARLLTRRWRLTSLPPILSAPPTRFPSVCQRVSAPQWGRWSVAIRSRWLKARRARKMLGGGMRQAGIVAAAGILSITSMIERLENDHAEAQSLAQGLAKISGILIDPKTVRTNMVFFDIAPEAKLDAHQLSAKLKEKNILMIAVGARRIRAVLHYWISPVQVEKTIESIKEVLQ